VSTLSGVLIDGGIAAGWAATRCENVRVAQAARIPSPKFWFMTCSIADAFVEIPQRLKF
jgi:hypothetical protein